MRQGFEADRQDAEAARLVAAGTTIVLRMEDHTGSWPVMRDIEDNEFCLS